MTEPRTATLDNDVSCEVCPHPWREHDQLGARYCAATTASALTRGCICR
ncbi:RGCVC family protein [Lentzea sp.]|nr:RGCVC family protein [Lentzea sp.]HUQ56342.1 RGCVC family protein [Lentzea sp.]